MLTEVKNNLRLIRLSLKYNIIKSMDNRISFISQIIGMILNNAIMIIQWIVLFSLKDTIGGYTFNDVLLLWGIASATFGVAHLFFNCSFELSELILYGKLDAFLVQPKNTLLSVSTSKTAVSAIGDIIYGLVLLCIVHPGLVPSILFILYSITGGIIMASCAVIFHSMTFFFGNSEELSTTLSNVIVCGGTYPDGIFDEKIKILFLTLIPLAWIEYLPLMIIKTFDIKIFISILLVTILIVYIAFKVFNKGLKRYSSSNLMSARI